MEDMQVYRETLGRRIADTVGKYPTKSAAAAAADVSAEQLNKWIAGTVKVPVEALYRLAAGINIDFCWLCAGNPPGAHQQRIQPEVLRDVLEAIAEVQAEGAVFTPAKYADLVLAIHDFVVAARERDQDVNLREMREIIRIAAAR